ncbi:eCIS core domain-containing protein [Streptomyces griseochromogenes]|uniref:eCIS core domain-containing protein n=1 Tax=Streptomyces griseochromogenes TaxID=68214 RepID=UPI0037B94D5A
MNSQAQQTNSEQSAEQRRRKRKERAARSRAPEPKNIVSGAGQPLDPGVRRELEEQLGHDLSRVRLHTGRDAGQLTRLLGADAVAVGQDVLFREGAFKPGTDEGRRLLAHELLHTVQNPHGLGTLRAGRETGAVSLPQQAIEREAESAARNLVRPDREERPAPEVEEGRATPGWLRYATVDADRNRAEAMDPATLVDRLANSVVRSLRGDPEDLSKRTRRQLAGLPEELLDQVLDRLENRLLGSEQDRVLELVDEIDAYDDFADDRVERDAHDAPEIEPDAAEEVRSERESAQRGEAEERARQDEPASAPGPEKERADHEGAPGSTPPNGGTREEQHRQSDSEAGGAARSSSGTGQREAAAPAPAGASTVQSGQGAQSDEKTQAQGADQGQKKEEGAKETGDQQGVPTAGAEESAARNRPGAAEQFVTGKQVSKEDKRGPEQPTASPTVGRDTELPAPSSRLDGARNQDLEGPEEPADDTAAESDSTSEVEVGGGEASAWDTKLQPEDFLPEQDPDLSAVPTADARQDATPAGESLPDFPAPPLTKADRVQAERDAEDAEDTSAEAEAESEDDTVEDAAAEPSTSRETVGGPGDTLLADLEADRTVASPADTGTVSKDPKHGDDPKAGPVTAQTTVQQTPGAQDGGRSEESGTAKENAAKEEKGTAAAGDRAAAAQEKNSPQAAGGTAAAPAPKSGQSQAPSAAAAGTERTDDARSPSAARDSHITGGSNADRPGSSTSGSQSGASPAADHSASEQSAAPQPAPARAAAPPAREPEPAAPASAPEAAAAEPAPKAERAPRTAVPKAAPASGATGGGVAGKPAGQGKGKKDSGPAPNLSQVSPEAGLSTAARLKPHQALEAMGGVSGSVDRSVGDEHKQLAAAPPSMQRPAGAPQTLEGKPKTDSPARYAQDPAQKSEAPEQENAEVTGAKQPEGQIEAEKAEEPSGWQTFKMALGFGIGWLAEKLGFKVDKQELAAKFAGLPTKDEALKQAQAGNAPGVQMQAAAEQTAGEQGSAVDTKGQETVDTARDDSGRAMGEDQVYPDAPQEQLKGKVPGADGAKAAAPGKASTGAVPPDAASTVAEHDRGPEFQAAFSQGQKGMSDGRQTKDKDFRDSQRKHKQQVDGEIGKNTREQTGRRTKALDEVTAQRTDWRKEQDQELQKLGGKKTERSKKLRNDVEDREKKTDDDVSKQKTDSDKQIKDKGDQAETDAKNKADGAAKDSGNWLTKAFDWIKEKVIEIKNAIVRVIRDARDAVVGFIKNFKETVERWIDEARKFIVDTVKNLIDDLIEFAKAMVRAVVELAARIRKFITDLIAAAIAFVTRLAAQLKRIVTDLLNALAKMLSDILNILKKMLMDVIKSVIDAIRTVLDYASKLLGAFGEFMMIAIDFLDDPGGWLSGAKNSAVDGAKNHLFREVQSAVKQWFQSKIEEIIGVPKAIIDKLIKGGFSLERIVKETWDAVVPQLPFIIGEIVITKVVAKLIPGAGWVTAVIDAIRTAIGALGEILRAMGAVLAWLRAVRQGGAGVLFAKAVAAGIVALLELAYQALLDGIGKYVAKVGKRLKGVAAKLGRGGREGRGEGRAPGTGADDTGAGPGRPKEAGPASEHAGVPARPKTNEPGTTRPTGKPDTRPTPSPRPKPEPAPRPEPEPDTRPKHTDDKAPDRPKDATPEKPKDPKETPSTTKPKGSEGSTPGRPEDAGRGKPREEAPGKPKGDGKETPPRRTDDKDAPAKPRPKDDKDAPGKPKEKPGKEGPDRPKRKPDKDGPDRPKREPDKEGPERPRSKPGEKGPGRSRPHHEKSGPGRPKPRREKDRRKQEENSKESKEERLQKIVARIRRVLKDKLKGDGMWEVNFRELLEAQRLWYRLTALDAAGNPDVTTTARLNPSARVIVGERVNHRIQLDKVDEDGLPKPELPVFHQAQASQIMAKFLSRHVKNTGQIASQAERGNHPNGWQYVRDKRLSNNTAWVRMHLLPEALGGMATDNNLVPARNVMNGDFKNQVERPAFDAVPSPEEMVWFSSRVQFHPAGATPSPDGYPEGFPRAMESSYGGYRRIEGEAREKRSSWLPLSAKRTVRWSNIPLPGKDEHNKLFINQAGEDSIYVAAGEISITAARYIAGKDADGKSTGPRPVYSGIPDIGKTVLAARPRMRPDTRRDLWRSIVNLKKLDDAGKIDWTSFR